jgi:hypothetical protein
VRNDSTWNGGYGFIHIDDSGPAQPCDNQYRRYSARPRSCPFRTLSGLGSLATYAACFTRLAIFAMVARLHPVTPWIDPQD